MAVRCRAAAASGGATSTSAASRPASSLSLAMRALLVAGTLLAACADAWQPDIVAKLNFIKYNQTAPKFQANVTDYFKLLAQDEHSLLIGARNHVYNVSLLGGAQLRENRAERIVWHSSDAHRELCTLKGKSDDDCQNYIRVFARTAPDTVQVCGTNSYKPLCRKYTRRSAGDDGPPAPASAPVTVADGAEGSGAAVSTEAVPAVLGMQADQPAEAAAAAATELVMSGEIEAQGRCPYSPTHNSTYVYTDGQLYSATVADFSGGDPLIYRGTQRTEQYDLKQLNQPDFVSAHDDRSGYVLFFFREIAMEYMNCGKAVYSRVGRVCKNDRGGPYKFKADRWTSFLKTRLNCSVPGDYPFYFDEIQATSDIIEGMYETASSHRQSLLYAVFTTSANAIAGSAICAFRTADIMAAFEGRFKSQVDATANWLPIAPDQVPEPRPGRCVEDSRTLHTMTVNFVRTHTLMDEAVPAVHAHGPLLTRVGRRHRFTAIAVDAQIRGLDGNHYDVLYVGTDDGQVLKIVHQIGANDTLGRPVVVSETQALPADQAVRELAIARGTQQLVVVGNGRVETLPLHHCAQIAGCAGCVRVQDPHCAWDIRRRECTAVDVEASALKPINYLQRLQPLEVDLCRKHGEAGIDAATSVAAAAAAKETQPELGPLGPAYLQPTVVGTRGTVSAMGRSLPSDPDANAHRNGLDGGLGGIDGGNDIVVASIDGSVLTNEINRINLAAAAATAVADGRLLVAERASGEDLGRAGMSGSSIAVIAAVLFVAGLTVGVVISRLRVKFGPCYNEHRNQINAYSSQKRHIQPLNSGKDINLLMEANAYSCHPAKKEQNLEHLEFAAKDRSHECKNSTENLEKEVSCKSTMGLTTVGATLASGPGVASTGGHQMGTLQKCKKTYL